MFSKKFGIQNAFYTLVLKMDPAPNTISYILDGQQIFVKCWMNMILLHDFWLDGNINESDAWYTGYRCTLNIHWWWLWWWQYLIFATWWCWCFGHLCSQGAIFLPGNKVLEHPCNEESPGKFLFEVIPGKIVFWFDCIIAVLYW